ncbi:hypothetical protein LOTGIDRAFT_170099 [Lottia gigantea]|uniref:Uncharacterized protein n=1 Tax=Lottia gigantea TaxID=225164 RepID=V3ZNA2_LOTGI|nr:hypothetical protein LOTGIDRAFT_170099 [Lottia gigantea]ESO82321.1 hypothetical protein LOTGIDRAFT_170099 [Lottia gigantea]
MPLQGSSSPQHPQPPGGMVDPGAMPGQGSNAWPPGHSQMMGTPGVSDGVQMGQYPQFPGQPPMFGYQYPQGQGMYMPYYPTVTPEMMMNYQHQMQYMQQMHQQSAQTPQQYMMPQQLFFPNFMFPSQMYPQFQNQPSLPQSEACNSNGGSPPRSPSQSRRLIRDESGQDILVQSHSQYSSQDGKKNNASNAGLANLEQAIMMVIGNRKEVPSSGSQASISQTQSPSLPVTQNSSDATPDVIESSTEQEPIEIKVIKRDSVKRRSRFIVEAVKEDTEESSPEGNEKSPEEPPEEKPIEKKKGRFQVTKIKDGVTNVSKEEASTETPLVTDSDTNTSVDKASSHVPVTNTDSQLPAASQHPASPTLASQSSPRPHPSPNSNFPRIASISRWLDRLNCEVPSSSSSSLGNKEGLTLQLHRAASFDLCGPRFLKKKRSASIACLPSYIYTSSDSGGGSLSDLSVSDNVKSYGDRLLPSDSVDSSTQTSPAVLKKDPKLRTPLKRQEKVEVPVSPDKINDSEKKTPPVTPSGEKEVYKLEDDNEYKEMIIRHQKEKMEFHNRQQREVSAFLQKKGLTMACLMPPISSGSSSVSSASMSPMIGGIPISPVVMSSITANQNQKAMEKEKRTFSDDLFKYTDLSLPAKMPPKQDSKKSLNEIRQEMEMAPWDAGSTANSRRSSIDVTAMSQNYISEQIRQQQMLQSMMQPMFPYQQYGNYPVSGTSTPQQFYPYNAGSRMNLNISQGLPQQSGMPQLQGFPQQTGIPQQGIPQQMMPQGLTSTQSQMIHGMNQQQGIPQQATIQQGFPPGMTPGIQQGIPKGVSQSIPQGNPQGSTVQTNTIPNQNLTNS